MRQKLLRVYAGATDDGRLLQTHDTGANGRLPNFIVVKNRAGARGIQRQPE